MKRLFLLSIVALMGTLNVLAWEKTVWQGYFDCSGDSWTQKLEVSKDLFADLENGDKVKFYAETQTGAQIQIAKNDGDKLVNADNFTSTYTYTTDNNASWFKENDFYIKGKYYNLYRITIIRDRATITVPDGGYQYSANKTDWWRQYGDVAMNSDNWTKTVNITPSSSTTVTAGGKITVVCDKGNDAKIKIQYSHGTYITHGGYSEGNYGEKNFNDYFTFTVPSDYTTHINNNENIQIKGKDFTISSVYYTAPSEEEQNYLINKGVTYSELNYEGNETMNNWSARGVVIKGNNVTAGNVLRILLRGTSVASYACLKTGSDWHEIMTGADKFSIAGWKYIDITINDALKTMLNSSTIDDGLRVNGIGYTFAGAYVITANGSYEEWTDGEVVSTYSQTEDTTATVSGDYFRKAGDGNGNFGRSIDNTKNNIVRVTFSEPGGVGSWLKAKDTDAVTINGKNCHAYYTRHRNGDNEYYNYIKFNGSYTATFPMSDVIAYFNDSKDNDIIDNVGDKDNGTKQGMLSDVTLNGMELESDKNITKVELVGSQTAKYVRGYAEFNHSLSASYWKPITLPYNLTPAQFHETFGKNAMICEIGGSSTVTKKLEPNKSGDSTIGIKGSTVATIAFVDAIYDREDNTTYERKADNSGWNGFKVKNVRANYPYIIHLDGEKNNEYREGTATDKSDFTVSDLRADVRDFKSYKFRSNNFTYKISVDDDVKKYLDNLSTDDNNKNKYNQLLTDFKIQKDENNNYVLDDTEKATYNNAYMYFISTAPVFNIRNENQTDVVEYYNPEAGDVNERTSITQMGSTEGAQNYYFYQGVLSPIGVGKTVKLKYGLGYLEFSKALIDLATAEEQQVSDGSTNAKGISMLFGEIIETEKAESETTDIKTTFRPVAQSSGKVFSLSGQCVSTNGITGLPKGIYIMDGKKIAIR